MMYSSIILSPTIPSCLPVTLTADLPIFNWSPFFFPVYFFEIAQYILLSLLIGVWCSVVPRGHGYLTSGYTTVENVFSFPQKLNCT